MRTASALACRHARCKLRSRAAPSSGVKAGEARGPLCITSSPEGPSPCSCHPARNALAPSPSGYLGLRAGEPLGNAWPWRQRLLSSLPLPQQACLCMCLTRCLKAHAEGRGCPHARTSACTPSSVEPRPSTLMMTPLVTMSITFCFFTCRQEHHGHNALLLHCRRSTVPTMTSFIACRVTIWASWPLRLPLHTGSI